MAGNATPEEVVVGGNGPRRLRLRLCATERFCVRGPHLLIDILMVRMSSEVAQDILPNERVRVRGRLAAEMTSQGVEHTNEMPL